MADEEVPQLKNHSPNLVNDNVSKLLQSWGLSELKSKFKSHQVEARALLCLTEKDICELIPKIGRRAIFRSNLLEWRRLNKRRALSLRRLSTRVESDTEEPPNIPIPDTVIKDEQMHSDYESEEISENMPIHNDEVEELETEEEEPPQRPSSDGTPDGKKFSVVVPPAKRSTNNNCHVDVGEILSNSYEGQQIIAYYEVHGSFDYSHRRRLVTLLINEVIRKNRWLVQDDFAKISNEIISLFPREDEATYYTARNGLKNPKGCLYNKFLNLTRKLRQEGILQYRNNVHVMPERVSARHSGEIKCYTESSY